MSDTVYLVTSGSYSDFRVDAVCISIWAAFNWARTFDGDNTELQKVSLYKDDDPNAGCFMDVLRRNYHPNYVGRYPDGVYISHERYDVDPWKMHTDQDFAYIPVHTDE